MDKHNVCLFAYALAEADNADGPSIVVRVKYRANARIYEEGAPWGSEKIEEDGLKDPGFGSGPVLFEDIEMLSVPRLPSRQIDLSAYSKKFDVLVDLCSGMSDVSVSSDAVTLNLAWGSGG